MGKAPREWHWESVSICKPWRGAAKGTCWLTGSVVCALPLQCIIGQGVMCTWAMLRWTRHQPARQGVAMSQDTERESGLLACSGMPTLWPFLGAEPCTLARGDKTLCGLTSSLPWKSCTAGQEDRHMLHMEPHISHSLKKKRKRNKEEHNKIHSSPFLILFDIGESHERLLIMLKV